MLPAGCRFRFRQPMHFYSGDDSVLQTLLIAAHSREHSSLAAVAGNSKNHSVIGG